MGSMEMYRDDYFKDCEKFLENKHSYKNHVNKFIEYLKLRNLENKPQAINYDVVDACIGYYRQEKKELNTRATMEAHLEALKSFYDYMGATDKEKDIFQNYNYRQFKKDMVEKYGLSEPVERGVFDSDKVIELLKKLEKAIDEYSYNESSIRDEERYLQRIILRLFIKITLIAPAKRNVIIQIKNCDFEEEYKKLNINSVKVNIPNGLSREINSAIKYAEEKNGIGIKSEDLLFEYIYRYKGSFRGEFLNTWFYNLVKDFGILSGKASKKTYPVEPIRNMAIKMLVENMVNPIFISKITGITFSSIEAQYYRPMRMRYEEYISENVNNAIAQNDYYYYI